MKGSSKILWVALLSVAYFAPGVADAAPAVQANDDSATTNEDTVVTVSVLANDTDTHGANRLLVTVNSVVVTSGAPSGTPTATVSGSPPNQTVDVTPGANFEPFFDELGALPPGPPDLAYVAALFGRYGMEILPPPATEQR